MPKLSPHRRSTRPVKQYRLEARITGEQRDLFRRAADLQGRSLTDFIIASVHSAAASAIEAAEVVRLNAKESRKLAEALVGLPRGPNAAMRAAKRHYRNAVQPR